MTATTVALDALEGTPRAVAFGGEEPRTVRLSLDAGEEVAEHSHPGREIVCYLVSGRLRLRIDGEDHVLSAGDLARFDGEQSISPLAIEESVAVLVLARRAD